jgi:hypothetical protein
MYETERTVTDDRGEDTLWGFEADGPSVLNPIGIKKDALQPGDLVTVTKADGTVDLRRRQVSMISYASVRVTMRPSKLSRLHR